jgi:hypothetical protein
MAIEIMMMALHGAGAARVELHDNTLEHPKHHYHTKCTRADKSLIYLVCFFKQLRFRDIVHHALAQYTRATRGELHATSLETLAPVQYDMNKGRQDATVHLFKLAWVFWEGVVLAARVR